MLHPTHRRWARGRIAPSINDLHRAWRIHSKTSKRSGRPTGSASDVSRAGQGRHVEAEVLRARHVPVPVGRRPARRPSRGLHRDRHRRALQAHARLQRAAPDGLGRVRPAGRAVRRPHRHASAHHHASATSQRFRGSSKRSASPTTGSARSTPPIPTTTSGRSGSSAAVRARARVPERAARELVPGARHGARQRGSHRRQVRSRRPSRACAGRCASGCCKITAYADGCSTTSTRSTGPNGTKEMQRNWIGRSEGAEVDFAVGARRKHGVRSLRVFTTRPDTLFGATYMVLAPEHPLVDAAHDRRASAPRSTRIASRPRARASSSAPSWRRTRPASSPARTRSTRSTSEQDPDLDRRLRARELRHRRDHGRARARRARLRVRADASACRSIRTVQPPADFDGNGAYARRRRRDQHRLPRRPQRRAKPRPTMIAWLEARSASASAASTTSCATGCSRASATGASRSRSCTIRSTASRTDCEPTPRSAGACCRSSTTSSRRGSPEGPLANADRLARDVTTRRQAYAPRDEHDAAVGRLVLVLPALSSIRTTTSGSVDPASSRSTGCRSISTSAAPSTPCCTCSTRASGTRCCSTRACARRPSRSRARQPGDDPGRARVHASTASASTDELVEKTRRPLRARRRDAVETDGRSARVQDDQEPRQRRQPGRHRRRTTAPTRCGSTRCSWGRSSR